MKKGPIGWKGTVVLGPVKPLVTKSGSKHRAVSLRCGCGRRYVRRESEVGTNYTTCGCRGDAYKSAVMNDPLYDKYLTLVREERPRMSSFWLRRPHEFLQWLRRSTAYMGLTTEELLACTLMRVDYSIKWEASNAFIVFDDGTRTEPERCAFIMTYQGRTFTSNSPSTIADMVGVSIATVNTYCRGNTSRGKFKPPREGCSYMPPVRTDKETYIIEHRYKP